MLSITGLTMVVAAAAPTTQKSNMNGAYEIASTPNAPGGKSTFPTNFADYPGGAEFFDVYHGPIKSVYGQVWWADIKNDIPDEIVQRFDGKVMAIVGIETDQVRKTPQGDVRVPISVSYNHHHDSAVVGKGTRLVRVHRDDPRAKNADPRKRIRLSHEHVLIDDASPSASGFPTAAWFTDGNGGEYRKTFHAYAPPFAQLVESPTTFHGAPMQIDTWNRDAMNLTGSPFVPGPYPKNNLAPASGPGAMYSGLLECPLTTRIEKIFPGGGSGWSDTHDARLFECARPAAPPHACKRTAASAAECLRAAKATAWLANATSFTSKEVHDDAAPPGCSAAFDAATRAAAVVYNSKASSPACCGLARGASLRGAASSLVQLGLTIDAASSRVSITLSGPADKWYGVGFNATMMADAPYAIIVDGYGNVTERKLGYHQGGTPLAPSVTVASSEVADGVRTVRLTRPLAGATADHYTFTPTVLALDFINALGKGPRFAQHHGHTSATILLRPSGGDAPTSACICTDGAPPFGQSRGLLRYNPTGETIGFPNKCDPHPRMSLLEERNPTCDLRTYRGGLATCHHGWVLLDADQEVPWQDRPLEIYKKYRVWFQEYRAAAASPPPSAPPHLNVVRQDWGIGADHDHAEYDVPRCRPGTPRARCTHTATGTWMPVPPGGQDMFMVLSHHHCHAPTCLRLEMWNNDTGRLLCRQEPLYGGTGAIDPPAFDEPGYIAMPPCMWGARAHGLEPPPKMNGVTIRVVSVTNATWGHHGEMALPEVSLVPGPLPQDMLM